MGRKLISLFTGINLIIALAALNGLLAWLPKISLDVSGNKLNSLSEASKNIIGELDDVVNVKVFVTGDLPAAIKPVANDMKTILESMARLNRQKLRISYLDPGNDEKAREEAVKYGIQPLQFSSIKSDKFEVQNGYFGLVMLYGDKEEVLPVADDVGNLEYFTVSGIKKLTEPSMETVALAEGLSGNTGTEIQYLRKYLEKSFLIDEVDLSNNDNLPEEAKTLLIAGINNTVDNNKAEKIAEWVEKGKGLIVFVDKIAVGANLTAAKLPETGLEKIFEDKGIKTGEGLVVDEAATVANFNSQNGAFLVAYPYWPEIDIERINGEIPALSGINSLMTAWVSPVEISGKAKIMFASSQKSAIDDSLEDLSPLSKKTIGDRELSSYPLAAINIDEGKVALIGDADMIRDNFVANNQGNLVMALNLVDYFSQDSELMSIRTKSLRNFPLKSVSDGEKNIIRTINLAAVVILIGLAYVIFDWQRKGKIRKWYDGKI